jgi:hypothetical protein
MRLFNENGHFHKMLMRERVKVILGPFYASHKSKVFLEMKGFTDPLQTPQTEGAHPPLAPTSFINLIGEGAENVITILNTISETKQVFVV